MYETRINPLNHLPVRKADDTISTPPIIIKTLVAKTLTAITLSEKIDWQGPSFLLHGSRGGWFEGHFSLLGGAPFGIFKSTGKQSNFEHFIPEKETRLTFSDHPLRALQTLLDRFQISECKKINMPFAEGGVVGFFSYELVRQLENIPETAEKPDLPDIYLLFLNFYILFDHRKNLIHLIYNPAPEIELGISAALAHQNAQKKIAAFEKMITALHTPASPKKQNPLHETSKNIIEPDQSKKHYEKMVQHALRYITDGDIFQANLSQRFSGSPSADTLFEIYKRLWHINPSPFSCFLDFGEIQIASASPERLVRITKNSGKDIVDTRPIAGTRPRGETSEQDLDFVNALYQSEKERAEHLMLVDLERNDLGKVCEYGSVEVDALMQLEKYSHVSHLVSNIKGTLRANTSPLTVLKALFPGGTITGVPKIRCMEIIAELEQKPRGIYTGSIGYIGFNGEMDLNIAIRTWVQHKEKISFQVGAGIVADSNPEKEYEETLQKAAALMKALNPIENPEQH